MNEKRKNFNFKIRAVREKDREKIRKFIRKHWGSEKVISRKKIYYPEKLPGFVAIKNNQYLGLITYFIKKDYCEIITINSLLRRKGIGTALIKAVKKLAKKSKCKRIWLVTTNDNLEALRFYQKRGFFIKAIYPDIIKSYRKLKPIPLIGKNGIFIRDEIELELKIK